MSTQREQPSIPLIDLATQSSRIKEEVLARIGRVIDKANYILGEEVAEFEAEFARYCGVEHCVGVANGTDAIHLALRALDIGPGDEVITAANSFAATALAIAYSGATPVLVDICEDDFNIDPVMIQRAITPNTKAIIPVHLYGQPARMQEILAIATRHDLKVIEDSAQGHGGELNGTRCGAFGDIACFSFYPGKNLGAFGDAGACVTRDARLAEKLQLLRNYGQVVKNRHDLLGFNCRLDTVQACVLLTKMQFIEEWTEQRRQVAQWYREELANTDLLLPIERSGARHVYHLFVIRHPERDQLMKFLAGRKIFCGIHYPNPLPTAQPFSAARTIPENVPVCTQLSGEILSLPMYPEMTREQVATVAAAAEEFGLMTVRG
ncbi:MAG: DegT/DnrJ/EryC1/StrS family aminotransferase [Pirellulaceae bacterium]|nr:DegT/DnrJ/EryC1/StrS family aminotransferase [Pirellulaceae bacterium]